MSDPVARVYDRWADYQWGRLDVRPVELHVHLTALREHLPPGSRVLDVGAGPGRYAVELARQGHRVTVGDLSLRQVELARERTAGLPGIESVEVLDARDLGRFADGSFDGLLALGPFYHLTEEAGRQRAAAEAARVLLPGGLLFASFMPRAFWLSRTLLEYTRQEVAPPAFLEHLERFWETGRLTRLKSDQIKRSWFCRLEEIDVLFTGHGLRRRLLLASSGVAASWPQGEALAALTARDSAAAARVLGLLYATASEPGVLAMSDQVLFVGEKEKE